MHVLRCWRSLDGHTGPLDLITSATLCPPSPPRYPCWPTSRCRQAAVRGANSSISLQESAEHAPSSSVSEDGSGLDTAQQPQGRPVMLLRPIQPQPVQLDAYGLVPCTASLTAVPQQMLPLLNAAVAVFREQVPQGLLGVYLRGSLVQGGFLPGLSDADFFALHTGPTGATATVQQAAERLQLQFPQCAKVELKMVALPPGSMLSALAQPLLGGLPKQHEEASALHIPPSAILDQPAGLAFLLKTQAVTLYGWDLPSLLPDVAALPPVQLLPSLVPDVEAALQHAAQAQGAGSSEQAGRAVRWALKRCIRAAFELRFCTTASAGAAVYSRDLYWCIHYAGQKHPELQQGLETAGQIYLALRKARTQLETVQLPSGLQPTAAGQEGSLLQEGAALAGRLAEQVDRLFLGAMLYEEPGWLIYHGGAAQPGAALKPGTKQPRSMTGGHHPGVGHSSASSLSWWQRLRLQLWAAGAGAVGASLEEDLVGCPPPPVGLPTSGIVLTLDWAQQGSEEHAAAIIAAAAAGLATAPLPEAAGAALPVQQPVLLKGAAAQWPAMRERPWSLGHLAAAGVEGRVRAAPSLQFPFTEPRLAAILAAEQGAAALPSCAANMSGAEFAARMQRGNPFRLWPLVYGRAAVATGASAAARGREAPEYYYLQAELPDSLLRDIDLSSPPFVLPGLERLGPLQQAQPARVWASPAGAVSPTHYDLSHSFLVQVKGRKRMLFWSPDDLPCLYFYPDTHMLRRRSRVNVHAPDNARYPLLARAAAYEAVLEPGDVVFFPSRWAHYTESLSFSISLTTRYAGVKKMR